MKFNITPNPADKQCYIIFENKEHSEIQWRLYSLNGILIKEGAYDFADNENKFLIETSDISTGVYLINIIGEDISATKRILIKH